ncbi:DsrE family protein [Pantoea ananatis]|uniref:DsrE family protein n=1 Tax=Pantoea ananas TaxID=553 RepID=UPI00051DA6D6|nr:hypothetical protein [Pantoea ananatis]KGL51651.1 hypothetical protein KR94_19335 [Pantoea ananatis]MCW0307976.1 hypothetical protein [Pantoea ananatis]MCW0339976.1 hypothetical protein [Pantoea ananatis]MCW0358172.1 hypothetical protein [Pantoea ananatis]MCW0362793.1 hypothetical protein [Pantoea ananatis]
MKIILHVPDKNRIAHALANAGNLLKEEDFDGDIAIVFNGDAAGDVTGRTISDALKNAPGVTLLLCNNALRAQHIDVSMLPSHFRVVPAAITYIIEQQSGGALYVRP